MFIHVAVKWSDVPIYQERSLIAKASSGKVVRMAKPKLIVARACNYKTKQELCMTFKRTLLTFQAVCVLLIATVASPSAQAQSSTGRVVSRTRREAQSPAHSLFFNQLRPGRRAQYRRRPGHV